MKKLLLLSALSLLLVGCSGGGKGAVCVENLKRNHNKLGILDRSQMDADCAKSRYHPSLRPKHAR